MNTFLGEVAKDIVSNHRNELHQIQIILPSKRASLFLKKELKKNLDSSYFLPPILTISDFVAELTEEVSISSDKLLFESYEVYKSLLKTEIEPFDSYAKWAPSLLSDISEVDYYLVDPKSIFSDLRNIKEIENWSFNEATLTQSQKSYLGFWNTILPFYLQLHKRLKEKGRITLGMAYRQLAENIDTLYHEIKSKKTYFIGFNALSNSEKTIFKFLKNNGLAEIIFDIDDYYLNITNHEAGSFYKKLKQEFSLDSAWERSNLLDANKSFHVISTPNDVVQSKVVSKLIEQQPNIISEHSAVVLSDESLLLPILQELPELVDSSNITMGYPPKFSLMHNLFMLLYKLHENSSRYSSKDIHRFHYKDFIDFIEHPVFVQTFDYNQIIKSHLIKRNITFVNLTEVLSDLDEDSKEYKAFEYLNDEVGFLFDRWTDFFQSPLTCFKHFVEFLKGHVKKEKSILEHEVMFSVWKGLNKINDIVKNYSFLKESKYFKTLFNSVLNSEQIDLVGEPLEGLQIIGMLETRLIDYENIIVTSVNEGIVPKTRIETSIIPCDLKRFYGLPTYKEKDAIYAYYFYRLLHRSNNVWFLYNAESEGMSTGEYSRFLLQLKHEFPFSSSIKEWSVEEDSSLKHHKEQLLEKDNFYQEKLNFILTEKGVSPSAINTYLTCSQDFYYKYILGLRENDEMEEEVGDNVFGTVIHNTLEDLYKPFEGKAIKEEDIKSFTSLFEPILISHFKKEYSKFYKTGKNLISFEMAKKIVRSFLKNELDFIKSTDSPLFIKSCEENLTCSVTLNINGDDITVKFKGIADRIDQYKGQYRVIDYKTGGMKDSDVSLKSIEDVIKKPKALQLMLYAYMFFQNHPEINEVSSHIFALRNLQNTNFPLSVNKEILIKRDQMMELENVLSEIISNMYDDESIIEHNDKALYCNYC